MIIGKMDKRIILQRENLIADGKGGWKTPTGEDKWLTIATVWAEFKKPTFTTEDMTGAVCSVSLREIKIRYRDDVVKGCRVVYGSETMSVSHVYDIGKTETFLVIKDVVK